MLIQGVMARTIADVRLGLGVVAGQHSRDPISVPAVLTDLKPGEKVRVAVMPTPPGGSTHAGVADVVRKTADALSNAGHDVVEATPPDFELACEVWRTQLFGELELQRELLEMVMGEGGRKFVELTTMNYERSILPPGRMRKCKEMGSAVDGASGSTVTKCCFRQHGHSRHLSTTLTSIVRPVR